MPKQNTTATPSFAIDDSGATAVEYALVLACIAAIIVAGLASLDRSIANVFGTLSAVLTKTTS